MKSKLTFALLALFSMLGTACNTVAGAGQDIEEAGETIENTAQDVRY